MEGKTIKMKAMKPTHGQLRQLVAENAILKQRLLAADKEQRRLNCKEIAIKIDITF